MTMMMTHAASCQHPVAQPQSQQQQQLRRLVRSASAITGGSAAVSDVNYRGGKKNGCGRRRMSTGGVGGGPFQVDDALVQQYAEMPIDR